MIDVGDCDRTAVAMMRLNGLSIKRIALALGISEHRVRQLLAERKRSDDEPPPRAA